MSLALIRRGPAFPAFPYSANPSLFTRTSWSVPSVGCTCPSLTAVDTLMLSWLQWSALPAVGTPGQVWLLRHWEAQLQLLGAC